MQVAANLIHAKYWGKDLNDLLQPVSDRSNLKYLTKEDTVTLNTGRGGSPSARSTKSQ